MTQGMWRWNQFLNLKYEEPPTDDRNAILAKGETVSASKMVPSLLYHAKAYVFADKYLADRLCILCLRKLHADLRDFDLTSHTSGHIPELLEFTYAQMQRKESMDDELRLLVLHYVACKGEILMQNPDLQILLEANAEMACDLLYKVWRDSVDLL